MRERPDQFLRLFGNKIGIPATPEKSRQLSPYHATVLTLLTRKPNISVVVVGANDGKINDPLFELVRTSISERVRLLLVEPQQNLIELLQDNYGFVQRKSIVNCAVGERGAMSLFTVKQSYWNSVKAPYGKTWPGYRAPSGVASTSKAHVDAWVRKYLKGYRPDEVIQEVLVPSKPLGDVLREQLFPTQIDVLQIDVEGNDDQVIYNSNLPEARPAVIHFETKHLSLEKETALKNFLFRQGYATAQVGHGDCIAIRQHPLEESS